MSFDDEPGSGSNVCSCVTAIVVVIGVIVASVIGASFGYLEYHEVRFAAIERLVLVSPWSIVVKRVFTPSTDRPDRMCIV